MHPDPQRLEDISSIRDAMRQISLEAEAVVARLIHERLRKLPKGRAIRLAQDVPTPGVDGLS
jgi:hypothetical protein